MNIRFDVVLQSSLSKNISSALEETNIKYATLAVENIKNILTDHRKVNTGDLLNSIKIVSGSYGSYRYSDVISEADYAYFINYGANDGNPFFVPFEDSPELFNWGLSTGYIKRGNDGRFFVTSKKTGYRQYVTPDAGGMLVKHEPLYMFERTAQKYNVEHLEAISKVFLDAMSDQAKTTDRGMTDIGGTDERNYKKEFQDWKFLEGDFNVYIEKSPLATTMGTGAGGIQPELASNFEWNGLPQPEKDFITSQITESLTTDAMAAGPIVIGHAIAEAMDTGINDYAFGLDVGSAFTQDYIDVLSTLSNIGVPDFDAPFKSEIVIGLENALYDSLTNINLNRSSQLIDSLINPKLESSLYDSLTNINLNRSSTMFNISDSVLSSEPTNTVQLISDFEALSITDQIDIVIKAISEVQNLWMSETLSDILNATRESSEFLFDLINVFKSQILPTLPEGSIPIGAPGALGGVLIGAATDAAPNILADSSTVVSALADSTNALSSISATLSNILASPAASSTISLASSAVDNILSVITTINPFASVTTMADAITMADEAVKLVSVAIEETTNQAITTAATTTIDAAAAAIKSASSTLESAVSAVTMAVDSSMNTLTEAITTQQFNDLTQQAIDAGAEGHSHIKEFSENVIDYVQTIRNQNIVMGENISNDIPIGLFDPHPGLSNAKLNSENPTTMSFGEFMADYNNKKVMRDYANRDELARLRSESLKEANALENSLSDKSIVNSQMEFVGPPEPPDYLDLLNGDNVGLSSLGLDEKQAEEIFTKLVESGDIALDGTPNKIMDAMQAANDPNIISDLIRLKEDLSMSDVSNIVSNVTTNVVNKHNITNIKQDFDSFSPFVHLGTNDIQEIANDYTDVLEYLAGTGQLENTMPGFMQGSGKLPTFDELTNNPDGPFFDNIAEMMKNAGLVPKNELVDYIKGVLNRLVGPLPNGLSMPTINLVDIGTNGLISIPILNEMFKVGLELNLGVGSNYILFVLLRLAISAARKAHKKYKLNKHKKDDEAIKKSAALSAADRARRSKSKIKTHSTKDVLYLKGSGPNKTIRGTLRNQPRPIVIDTGPVNNIIRKNEVFISSNVSKPQNKLPQWAITSKQRAHFKREHYLAVMRQDLGELSNASQQIARTYGDFEMVSPDIDDIIYIRDLETEFISDAKYHLDYFDNNSKKILRIRDVAAYLSDAESILNIKAHENRVKALNKIISNYNSNDELIPGLDNVSALKSVITPMKYRDKMELGRELASIRGRLKIWDENISSVKRWVQEESKNLRIAALAIKMEATTLHEINTVITRMQLLLQTAEFYSLSVMVRDFPNLISTLNTVQSDIEIENLNYFYKKQDD